ncbi:two-partner secretion domain-containing protein [Vacuolonema iberomarrocanum]|uniref:filamentous hemagglutinin N-terminal domain-containing protein n=1 Tax=Vacuolonema iberomarrocanum TaxID=3454632 RepID=UPI0019FF7374|nr:filamentous hemagglutinin N-terminal domain-containing protein [filamentous cyanobacterium LEGE 07170]
MLAFLFSPDPPAIPTPPSQKASLVAEERVFQGRLGVDPPGSDAVSPMALAASTPDAFGVEFSEAGTRAIAPLPIQLAQNVQAAEDGTGTVVDQVGDRFDIDGGTQAGDNLFHSFEAFGLDADQVANFIAEYGIENILGRITGGDPSIIDGLIQMSGGDANLYLINPAGILFGPNASLDLPASFTATTADRIGFGSGWFRATGDNDFASLVGAPQQFAFIRSDGGAIVNLGDLQVDDGQSLSLLGGTVINMGTLAAPQGQVTIAAVPGENLVRISQDGILLSLEIPEPQADELLSSIDPLSLPELLTGADIEPDTGIAVNPDGTLQVGTATVEPTSGTAIASGTVTVADTTSPTAMGGTIALVGDRVALLDATLDSSGTRGGGTVLVGGSFQGQGPVPNATQTYVDATTIRANAIQQGNGGEVSIWADDRTQFSGTIHARGGAESGDGGMVEVSGGQHLAFRGHVDLSAPQGELGTLLLDPENIVIVNGNGGANDDQLDADVPDPGDSSGTIFDDDDPGTTFTLSETTLEAIVGDIILLATNDIIIEDLADNTLNTQVPFGQRLQFIADADGDGTGAFQMDPTDTLQTDGGAVFISGAELQVGNIRTTAFFTTSGEVNLSSTGMLTAGNIETAGGDVLLSSVGDLQVGAILIRPDFDPNVTGDVILTSEAGNVELFTVNNEDIFGTVRISAAELFRATGTFEAFFTPFAGIPGAANMPVSIRTTTGADEPIRIRYGGAVDADPNLSTVGGNVPPVDPFTITIGGDGAPFSVGPEVVGVIDPDAGELVDGNRNEVYAPRPIPDDVSGTSGAIAVSPGNGVLYGSVEDIPFVPDDDLGGEDPGDVGGGEDPGDVGGEDPGDVGGGEDPGDVGGGEDPGDVGGGEDPGDEPGGGDVGGGDPDTPSSNDDPLDTAGVDEGILLATDEAQSSTPPRSDQCDVRNAEVPKVFSAFAPSFGNTAPDPCLEPDRDDPILQIESSESSDNP